MKKFYITLLLCCSLCKQTTNADGRDASEGPYQSVLLIKSTFNDAGGEKEKISIPTEVEVSSDGTLIATHTAQPNLQEIYLCPADAENNEIKTLSRYYDNIEYCLFEKAFQENEEKKCKIAPNPQIIKNVDFTTRRDLDCYKTSKDILYSFSIKYCYSIDKLGTLVEEWRNNNPIQSFKDKMKFKKYQITELPYIGLYDICYNASTKKTIWTRHVIGLPSTYQNENEPDSYSSINESLDYESQFPGNDVGSIASIPEKNSSMKRFANQPTEFEAEISENQHSHSGNTSSHENDRESEPEEDLKKIRDYPNKIETDKELPDEQINLEHENVDIKKYFIKMDNAFKAQDRSSLIRWIPQRLVPMEDRVYDIWEKATTHYINIAPLRLELRPLMETINYGIRRAAVALQKQLLRRVSLICDVDPSISTNNHNLVVYTTTYNLDTSEPRKYLNDDEKFPVPDIWCKIVYQEDQKMGLAIFLHNILGNPPNDETYQCEIRIACDFDSWNENEVIKHENYAYCCAVTQKIVESLFPQTELTDIEKTLYIEDLIKENLEGTFDPPLVLIERYQQSENGHKLQYHLPSKTRRENDELTYLTEQHENVINACPTEKPEDITMIREISNYYWATKYCLIEKNFAKDESKICQMEIEPVLMTRGKTRENGRLCGPTQMDWAMKFIYPYCHSTNELKKYLKSGRRMTDKRKSEPFPPDVSLIEMYEICYDDAKMRTVYTHHGIMSPLLFQDEIHNEHAYDCNQISIESYGMKKEQFRITKTFFKQQDKTDPDYMIPQMLVPKEDMASTLWKKSTCHSINIAPLWNKLAAMMDLVNTRVRNVAIQEIQELSVYTALLYPEEHGVSYIRLPIPDTWCKLVYDPIRRSGVAVIIHNTPNDVPTANQMCEEEFKCDFKNWPEMLQLSQTIDDEYLKYAYCCKVTEKIEKIYRNDNIKIRNVLDLNILHENKSSVTT